MPDVTVSITTPEVESLKRKLEAHRELRAARTERDRACEDFDRIGRREHGAYTRDDRERLQHALWVTGERVAKRILELEDPPEAG